MACNLLPETRYCSRQKYSLSGHAIHTRTLVEFTQNEENYIIVSIELLMYSSVLNIENKPSLASKYSSVSMPVLLLVLDKNN